MRVLVVEDEQKISQFITQTIAAMGHAVDPTLSAQEAQHLFEQNDYDLVMLDIMLPDGSGLNLCQEFKRKKPQTPIMMLTTLSQTPDKVRGLDAGAEDYMTKPFSVDELSARVRALLRRNTHANVQLRCADLSIDLLQHTVTRAGVAVKLTTKEFALLEYFMRNLGRPLSRTQIAQHVWDLHFDPGSNVVDVYIKQLRKKIDAPHEKKLIKTIVGLGYMLNDE